MKFLSLSVAGVFLSVSVMSGCAIKAEKPPEADSQRPVEPARPAQPSVNRPTRPVRPAPPPVREEAPEVKEIPVATFSDLEGGSLIPLGMMEIGDELICGKGGEVEDSFAEERDGYKIVYPQIIATQSVQGLRCMGTTYQLIGVASDNLFELKQDGVPGVVFPLDHGVDLSKAVCAGVEEENLRSVALNGADGRLSTIWTSNYLDRGDLQQVHNNQQCVSISFDQGSTVIGPQPVLYPGFNR